MRSSTAKNDCDVTKYCPMYSIAKNLLSISIYAACLILTVMLISLPGSGDFVLAESMPVNTPISVSEPAASLFTANCAGCHAGGGNVIRRGKSLKSKALARYGYDDAESIAQIVTNGRGIMPAYVDRLSSEEIGALAQYVLQQAEAGWPN